MSINPQKISELTQQAYSMLKNKTLGGVSKESAQTAISEAVNKAVQMGEEAVGKVQQEMQALRGKTAREIAEITSQKDVAVFNAKQEAAQAIARAKDEAAAAVKKAKSPKQAERVLPNGHKEVRKVNRNGAVMVKEYNEAGQLLKSNVTTLDGTIRRTSYNPLTGKPVKTFTNTSGKDMLIEYSDNGMTKMTGVNNKKAAPQKPTLVSQTRPRPVNDGWSGETGQGFERIYSDGSKEEISRFFNPDYRGVVNRTILKRYDKDGKLVYDQTKWPDGNAVREHIYKDNRRISKEYAIVRGERRKSEIEAVYDNNTNRSVIVKAKKETDESKTVYTALKDELGFYTGKYRAKTTYPKGSGKQPEITEVPVNSLPCVY